MTDVEITATISTQSYGAGVSGTLQFFKNGAPWQSFNATNNITTPGQYASNKVSFSGSMPLGTTTISAQYSGDRNYAGSASAPVTITVTDFSVSANPATINISAPGQGGSSAISVAPLSGFTGTVNLSVEAGCPTGATCTVLPASVNVTSASPVTSTLTITTTGSAVAPPLVHPKSPPSFHLPVELPGLLAGVLLLAFLVGTSAKRWRPAIFLAASVFLIAGVWVACGGGASVTPPPAPAPAVRLMPSALAFNAQMVGTTSPSQSVMLTNIGNAGLNMGSSITGTNSGDFVQTSDCKSPIVASASCSISVTFSPTAAGSRSAAVTIIDDASGSPHTTSLSGTAIAPPTPTGTYPMLATAASGSDSHSITVKVVVH